MDVIYSLYPVDFAQENSEQGELLLMDYQGVKLYARHLKGREYQVEQILSTEPQDFLKKSIATGAVIKM